MQILRVTINGETRDIPADEVESITEAAPERIEMVQMRPDPKSVGDIQWDTFTRELPPGLPIVVLKNGDFFEVSDYEFLDE